MSIRTEYQGNNLPIPNRRPKHPRSSAVRWLRGIAYTLAFFVLLCFAFLIWFFFTGSGTNFRYMLADTIITTQHRDWARYLIGQDQMKNRIDSYNQRFDQYASTPETNTVNVGEAVIEKKELVTVEPISGPNFTGYLVSVSDPTKIRLAVPNRAGKGEKVTSMVKRTGALVGINAGGFADPNWKGNGFQPIGIVMSGGKIYYNDGSMTTPVHVVGIDGTGKMIAGKYSPNQLIKMGMKEAVSFAPKFIVNGVGQIKNEADGWGIAPRTCMAQKEDGTIMFAVIDGRQTHSIGATLYDIQKIFLEHGAVIAANLDGGASTVLVKDNQIINSPSSQYGERYLPTAWLVFEHPEDVAIKNIWAGIDMKAFDASKW